MRDGFAIDAATAASLIPDGATIAISGSGGGLLEPDAILAAIEVRFLATGHPRALTVIHAQGIGDGERTGLNRLAHPGLVRCVIGGHWAWSPRMQALAIEGAIEAYALPTGLISLMMREAGAGRPGVLSKVGLGTFVDPRLGGGALNASNRRALVQLEIRDGEEWLFYPSLAIDFAILRGSLADWRGNVSLEREPADLDAYALALAARNGGGKVLVQVQRAGADRVPARLVALPGALVDVVVEHPEQMQTHRHGYEPALSGQQPEMAAAVEEDANVARRIIGRRGKLEMSEGDVVCYGFGIPDAVAARVAQLGEQHRYRSIIDHGVHGGTVLAGKLFGVVSGADAIIPATDQLDFLHGGGVDVAFLGVGEMDRHGNVNVSMLGGTPVGPGAFMDIAQSAKKVVFCGTFEARGSACAVRDKRLEIVAEGAVRKLVEAVSQVSYPGGWPARTGRPAMFVTERCVIEIGPEGPVLTEIAPGIDLHRDILERCGFALSVSAQLKTMALDCFDF